METDVLTNEFIRKHGKYCAYILISKRQILFYLSVCTLALLLFCYRWDYFLCVVTLFMSFWYFSAALFKTYTAVKSCFSNEEHKISDEEIRNLNNDNLPKYTILVPLYKESNIADKIIKHLDALDYPKHKLNIILLLEEDDEETLFAIEEYKEEYKTKVIRVENKKKKVSSESDEKDGFKTRELLLSEDNLPPWFDIIIVPNSIPKTKPKACNYGLKHASGDFCVIYDAEDRPEPDQLKKVIIAFQKADKRVACIQAKLNYYNPNQNILTKCFTVEYTTTFDLFLPGLSSLDMPIPLGGTSNHFRTDILREIGGWDPFNVTEDCDLGVRIYKKGYKTAIVDSTTWEEANSKLWNWIRQRSRWVKGFFQTHLTHMRHPYLTLKSLGLKGYMGFMLSIGAASFMMLMNLIYWIVGILYILLAYHAIKNHRLLWQDIILGPHKFDSYAGIPVFGFQIEAWPFLYVGQNQDTFWVVVSIASFIITCVLLCANFLFILIHCIACIKRRYYYLLPYALLMPFYWVLISIGAWKGFIQLFINPYYWEKTEHGLAIEQKDY